MKTSTKLAGALAAALALAGGLAMAGPGTAHAAGAAPGQPRAVVPDPGWNEIIWPDITNRSNVMCLDVPGGSTRAGQFLQLWHCHGSDSNGAAQRWQFIPVATAPDGRTAYVIRNTGSFFCLSWAPLSTAPSSIFQTACPVIGSNFATVWLILDGDPVEPWKFELQMAFLSDGAVRGLGSLCLQAANTSDVNGTPIGVGTCAQFNDQTQMLALG